MDRRIYVGWDSREDIAYQVCKHSIQKHSKEIDVQPLKLYELREKNLVTRPPDAKASTEFTFTRFLVPHLNGYKGWALFVDCDFLFVDDANKLFDLADENYAVMVVKHDYEVKDGAAKMDGQVQHAYPRKNWSSCILFNCGHPSNMRLSPSFINDDEMSYLHQFKWLRDEDIGTLPHHWNWLVGHYIEPEDGHPKAIHYTLGGPWFDNYKDVQYADLWLADRDEFVRGW